MASPISAVLFRVGFNKKSKAWFTEWVVPKRLYSVYLQKALNLLLFVKHFFNQYTTPLFGSTYLRNTISDEKTETTGEENIIKNAFVGLNFLYAKTNIYCGITLQIVITLYDTLMEQLRNTLLFMKELVNKFSLMFKTIIKKKKKKRYYLKNKKTLHRKNNYRLPNKRITKLLNKLLRKLRLQPNFAKSNFFVVGKNYNNFKKKYGFWDKKHSISKRKYPLIKRTKHKINHFFRNIRKKWFIRKRLVDQISQRFNNNTSTKLNQ